MSQGDTRSSITPPNEAQVVRTFSRLPTLVDARGRVSNVELLVFRESRGSEVRTKRFNVQYEGKTASDPVRLNKDIIIISGATMSVRSMTAGIKRVLVLVDEFYLRPAGIGSDTVATRKSEKGIFGSIFGN